MKHWTEIIKILNAKGFTEVCPFSPFRTHYTFYNKDFIVYVYFSRPPVSNCKKVRHSLEIIEEDIKRILLEEKNRMDEAIKIIKIIAAKIESLG